jgi:hypothetical protein
MTETNAEPLEAGWKPVAGITVLLNQINKRWPNRDKASDGIVGDAAHAARASDHNPDGRGYVHALDIDEDFRGSKNDNRWYADQLIAYARTKRPGWARLKYVVYENQIASGTYASQNWVWRNGDYGHTIHIHTSFTRVGETDPSEFQIPILFGQKNLWDGVSPYFDLLQDAEKSGQATKATYRLACRLAELGFFEGVPAPEGKQGFPSKAIKNMQDYMGWERTNKYEPRTHKAIFKELKLSNPEP